MIKMKKNTKIRFFVLWLCFSAIFSATSQVTIGVLNPPLKGTLLDLKESDVSNGASNSEKGLMLPRVTLTSINSLSPILSGKDLTDAALKQNYTGLIVYNVTTTAPLQKGLYSWDGTKWVALEGVVVLPWQDTGAPLVNSTEVGTDVGIFHVGAVTIGSNTAAAASAIMDVKSTNKGVLLPRVALASSKDATTIPNPALGLLVYNTGTHPDFSTEGYMFWNGTDWMVFGTYPSVAASAFFDCARATLSPNQEVKAGVPLISGSVMQIPYSGSNGGIFHGATLTSIGNSTITATVVDGFLAHGNGVLNFAIEGTPMLSQEPPTGIRFNMQPFYDANSNIYGLDGCAEARIGDVVTATIDEVAVMGYMKLGIDEDGNSNYYVKCDSPDGKFSVRVRVPSNTPNIGLTNQSINVQVRNNQETQAHVIWNYNTIWSGGLMESADDGTMPVKKWGGFDNTWADSGAATAGRWGNVGIYDGTGPEYRRYTWIPTGASNKVFYEVVVMSALDVVDPQSGVTRYSTELLKVTIVFKQVTAI